MRDFILASVRGIGNLSIVRCAHLATLAQLCLFGVCQTDRQTNQLIQPYIYICIIHICNTNSYKTTRLLAIFVCASFCRVPPILERLRPNVQPRGTFSAYYPSETIVRKNRYKPGHFHFSHSFADGCVTESSAVFSLGVLWLCGFAEDQNTFGP